MGRDVYWYVSLADVVLHPRYNKGASLEEILHDFGMDITKGFLEDDRDKVDCKFKEDVDEFDYYHRSLAGHVVKCPRYVGKARQDGEWRKFVSHHLNLPAELTGANLR